MAAIRYGIREPTTDNVTDQEISDCVDRSIIAFGQLIKASCPEYLHNRECIASYTNVFDWPSDCLQIVNVFDLRTTAIAITGATNATPIVITAVAHGRSDGDIVHVQDVGGNDAANGVLQIDNSADGTLELVGSVGDGAYTSGGLLYQEKKNMTPIYRIGSQKSRMANYNVWFPRGEQIVVDNDSFTRDIVVDYIKQATTLDDIPTDFHEGLIAWCIIDLMVLPDKSAEEYNDRSVVLNRATKTLDRTVADIERLKVSSEPQRFPRGMNLDAYAT
jgi:hypothetical protein